MKTNVMTTGGGALLILIGTFLPWFSLLGFNFNGWTDGAGTPLFFIVLGLLCVVISVVKKRLLNIVSIILSLITILIGLILIAAFIERTGAVGIGMWSIAVGGVLTMVGAIMGIAKKKAIA